jgi:hypothetical protein
LTADELKQLAPERFAEAAALPAGANKQEILQRAHGYQSLVAFGTTA